MDPATKGGGFQHEGCIKQKQRGKYAPGEWQENVQVEDISSEHCWELNR